MQRFLPRGTHGRSGGRRAKHAVRRRRACRRAAARAPPREAERRGWPAAGGRSRRAWAPRGRRGVGADRGARGGRGGPGSTGRFASSSRTAAGFDPLSLDDYRRHDGCRGVAGCLERLAPGEVVELVRAAGLRRRRGASGAVATAWGAFRNASGADRCIVCNADEGDPAAATARTLLEGDPFRVIEGLVIAAYAVGASHGVLRVRRADRVAVDRARAAVDAAEQGGLLGDRVMGSAFGFHLDVVESAGPAWCGDETALADILTGARAGGVVNLRGRTPLITDVETVAALPWILRRGPEAYAAVGTAAAGGTRVLSLGGKIVRGGLVEVPMGTSIRRVVQDIGGGVPGGGPLKADPGRRSVRRVHPGGVRRDAHRRRSVRRGWGHGRVRKSRRSRRRRLHRRIDPPRAPHTSEGRVPRLCARHGPCRRDARDLRPGLQGGRAGRRPRPIERPRAPRQGRRFVRSGKGRTQPRAHHARVVPRGVQRPRARPAVPGGDLPVVDPLHGARRLRWLYAVCAGLSARGHRGAAVPRVTRSTTIGARAAACA